MERPNPYVGTDAIRINIGDTTELKYWAAKFGVSRSEVKSAVEEAGDSLTAVRRHLRSGQRG